MPRSVPNYLTIEPNGTVNAEFTGHVIAQGVDLKDAPGRVISGNTIRWLDLLNADANQKGFAQVTATALEDPIDSLQSYELDLFAYDAAAARAASTPSPGATLQMYVDHIGQKGMVNVEAWKSRGVTNQDFSGVILDSNGKSDFMIEAAAGYYGDSAAHGRIPTSFWSWVPWWSVGRASDNWVLETFYQGPNDQIRILRAGTYLFLCMTWCYAQPTGSRADTGLAIDNTTGGYVQNSLGGETTNYYIQQMCCQGCPLGVGKRVGMIMTSGGNMYCDSTAARMTVVKLAGAFSP